jgi:hypothetical protein
MGVEQPTVTLPAPPPLSAQPAEAGQATAQPTGRAQSPAGTSWWTPAPAPSRPPVTPQRQFAGGLLLGVGILLVIIGGAAAHGAVIVILVLIGLAVATTGGYQLIPRSGKGGKPPGPT